MRRGLAAGWQQWCVQEKAANLFFRLLLAANLAYASSEINSECNLHVKTCFICTCTFTDLYYIFCSRQQGNILHKNKHSKCECKQALYSIFHRKTNISSYCEPKCDIFLHILQNLLRVIFCTGGADSSFGCNKNCNNPHLLTSHLFSLFTHANVFYLFTHY